MKSTHTAELRVLKPALLSPKSATIYAMKVASAKMDTSEIQAVPAFYGKIVQSVQKPTKFTKNVDLHARQPVKTWMTQLCALKSVSRDASVMTASFLTTKANASTPKIVLNKICSKTRKNWINEVHLLNTWQFHLVQTCKHPESLHHHKR